MASAQTDEQFTKGDVELTGSVETLMITLLCRALDAESPRPVLNDQQAVKTVARIRDDFGYDFSRVTGRGRASKTLSVASRARDIDSCVEDFVARQHAGRPATVLHLACGLDARSLRVAWQGEGRLWIDADTREAVDLRRRVMDEPRVQGLGRGGEYRLLHPNINQPGWVQACGIPNDRPVLVVFEGLTPYLTEDQVHTLLRRLVNHFGEQGIHGEMVFDAVGSVLYFLLNFFFSDLKALGTRLNWYMDRPKQLEHEVAGLSFKERVVPGQQNVQAGQAGSIMSWVLWFCDLLHISERLGGTYVYTF